MNLNLIDYKWSMALYVLLIGFFFTSSAQEAVPFTARLDGGNIDLRGDIILVGNNILNSASQAEPSLANTPYNGIENNNNLWMEYINIDGDPSTFSSSSAELNIPDPSCSQVRYAGLYWAATYPNERSTDGSAQFNGTPRIEDWFNIKFKIPGGSYVDLTADTSNDAIGNEDDIIFDGYDYNNINNSFKDAPYICYKNVTDLVRANADPNGEYTVANVRATKGVRNGSSSAGWVMVVIYENPSESGKFISLFDGYAGMSGAVGSVDINVNGFKTLPSGFPVNARLAVGALEGDRSITNDRFALKANMAASFTDLSTTNLNPIDNFFNSTISNNDAQVSTRTPFGTNTLGLDLDIFDLNNPNNTILPNNETGATMRFTSTGDGYGSFLAAFLVEQIEPEIVLEKRVEDIGGNDITGMGVNLGQTLDYVLTFQNIGNDDTVNYTIRDVLPINVTLDEANLVLPSGVTYTFDETTRTIVFAIPDGLVQENDPPYSIRMRVKVAENCYDFVDACTDQIQNLAYSTYSGAINSNVITDDPSVYNFDNCGFIVPGATNFLLDDLEDCTFTRTVKLCGTDVLLNAGDNFDNYIWVRDENGNGQIDSTDRVMNDGDPDNDPSSLLVDTVGTYIVDKIVADPCKGFKEIFIVEPFGGNINTNPIIEHYNAVNSDADPSNNISGEIVQCSIDGGLLPKLFLCGINDSANLLINSIDAQNVLWEKLDELSCEPSGDDCANKNSTCTWSQIAVGNSYSVNEAGKYRVVVNYQNGCFDRYYFNVFQNDLDIQFNKNDIICATPGNITITNLGDGYGYQLVNATNGAIIVPFSANNGPSFDFSAGQNGGYRVEVTQLDNTGIPISGACVFSTPDIGILDRVVNYDVNVIPETCSDLGSINIQVNNAQPNYEFEIRLDDGSNGGQGTLLDTETTQQGNSFTFENLQEGNYIAIARTDDGCSYSEQITVDNYNTLALEARVSQHITCKEGNILMSSVGGKTPHTYAIWSYVNEDGVAVTSYPTVDDVPASAFQTSQIFDILDPGDYTFLVIDRFNCPAISNTVTIEFRPAAEYNATSVIDVLCFGEATGSIKFNLVNDNGYQLTYYLFDASTFDEENYDYNNALATNTSGNFPSLSSGDYVVVINQRKGSASCDYFEYHTISAPANAISGNAVLIQDYTCTQDGIIEAQNVMGGTAPYEYSIDGVNFFSGVGAERFTGLKAGTYTITIRDAVGCVLMTNPITLDPLNSPSDLIFTATQPVCPTLVSDVTVTVVDGNAPFTYEIIAPAADVVNNGANPTFTDLSPKTYTFQVTDVKGCVFQESYTIAPITPINVSGQLNNNVTCFGVSDGGITFNVGNFITSYDYVVTGPVAFSDTNVTASSVPLTGLTEGVYTITVTDTNTNCTATTNLTVTAPPSTLVMAGLNVTEISCASSGAVIVSATGGWGGYEYELVDPSGSSVGPQGNNTFSGLTDTSGNYTVIIRDAGGCEVSQTFALTPSPPPVLELIANSLCYDSTTGLSLTANVVSGGTAPFQYRLNGGAYQSGNNFTGLGPGSYTVEVVDSKNCSNTTSLEIFPTLAASSSLIKGLDCSVLPNAEIEIFIGGGAPNYTYEVYLDGNLEQASTTVSSIPFSYTTPTSGTYTFNITDASGCSVSTTTTVVPYVPPSISLLQTTEILCNGENGGTIQVNIDGTTGIPPYTISVVNITTGTPYGDQTSGLPAGEYEITVTDSRSCSDTETIIIDEPEPITYDIVVTPIKCSTDNDVTEPGSISVINVLGGTEEYTYYLTGNNGHLDNYLTTSGGENYTFTILEFGIYQVDVVDANGCSVQTTNIIASLPDDLKIDVETTTVNCSLGGTAVITVNSPLGSGNYEFAILETFTAPYVDDPANDYQSPDSVGGDTATFTGLTPGIIYSFVVYDIDSDCYYFESAEFPIDTPSDLTSNLDAINNVSCKGNADGNVSFTLDGYAPDAREVKYEIFNFQSNTTTGIASSVNVNPPSVGSGVSVTNVGPLAPGTYYILFNEVDGTYAGCSVGSEVFTILESTNPLQVTASLIKNDNCNLNAGQVSAIGQFGTAPYEYQIALSTDTEPTVATWAGSTANVFNVEGGDYTVYIKDANNCIQQDAVVVPTDSSPEISLAVNNQCLGSEGNYAIDITLTAIGISPYAIRVDGNAPIAAAALNASGNMITISGLNSGSHTIEILDSNGCGVTETIIIAPELEASAMVMVQPSCNTDDGVIAFTITGGSGSYTTELLAADLSLTGIPQTGNEFRGVPFGDYVVRVTDNTLGSPNCYVEVPISLEEPTPITLLSTDWTNVSCFGGSDGSIAVNLEPSSVGVNDNPPYIYEITDGTATFTQNTGLFTGLTAGVWDITVTSNRNCIATDQVTIGAPIALEANITNVVPFACDINNATQAAVIEVTITPGTGTPDYFYSVNGGSFLPTGGTVFTYKALNSGNYDIVIRDANGCLIALPTETIDPLNSFTATISPINAISCVGPEEIVITVQDDGNPNNSYSFELLPVGNPNGILTGSPTNKEASYELTAVGSYTFKITDNSTGCYITLPYEIAPYDLMDLLATANSPVTCFGDSNGTLDMQITGYSGAYNYEVFTQAGASVQAGVGNTATNPLTIDGLSGGNYYVRVTQTAFPYCPDDSNVITIGSPNMPLTAIVDPVAEAECTDNMGEILVDPSGGYAPYNIVLTNTTTGQVYNANNVGAMLFTGLSAGNFNVQVTDSFGCIYIDAEMLSPAVPIVANAIPLTTMLSCYGDNNATVTAIVTGGGSGIYEYRLNYYDDAGALVEFTTGEQTSNTFTGLGAGIYSITVTDGWNCDVETNKVTITQPPIVSASLVRTDPLTCATGAEFELTAIGGSGTYEYSTDNITFLPMTSNPMGIPAFGVLGAGTYQYYVRDAINGCEAIVSNAITENPIEPLILTVDKTAAYINCTGENTAIISAEASGGLGNYQYELYLNSIAPANRLVGPQSVGEFKDLVAGTYWVNVISEDCTTAPEQVIIGEPIPLTYTDQVVDVSCFGEENGSITVNLEGGAGGYIYSISPNLDKFDSINTFTDLAPGDYVVIAQDQNGCFEYLEYTITEPALIEVSATTTPEICVGSADGAISLSISGGTAPYSTAINSNADTDYILGRTDFSDLSVGDYLIFIKDAQDCETYIVATIDPGVDLRATVEPVYECIGNIPSNYVNVLLEDQSVLAEVMYGLDTTDLDNMQLDPNFRNIAPGNHYIAIAHANGCIETVGFFIENYEPLTLTLEQRNVNEITAVAQGGRLEYTFYLDGIDRGSDTTFRIRRTGTYEVRVVDENGCEAIANIFVEFIDIEVPNFYTPNGDGKNDLWKLGNGEYFPNLTVKIYDRYGRIVARLSNIEGWDGTYEGKELPTGDYWYVVQFNEEDYQREFFGHFTLYR